MHLFIKLIGLSSPSLQPLTVSSVRRLRVNRLVYGVEADNVVFLQLSLGSGGLGW